MQNDYKSFHEYMRQASEYYDAGSYGLAIHAASKAEGLAWTSEQGSGYAWCFRREWAHDCAQIALDEVTRLITLGEMARKRRDELYDEIDEVREIYTTRAAI